MIAADGWFVISITDRHSVESKLVILEKNKMIFISDHLG